MSETSRTDRKSKLAPVRRVLTRESLLEPGFAAARRHPTGDQWTENSPQLDRLLQRTAGLGEAHDVESASSDGAGDLAAVPLGRDFSRVPLHASGPEEGHAAVSCALTPRRCPFGGACHGCPGRVQAKRDRDQNAADSARSINALAYAVGQNVVLGLRHHPLHIQRKLALTGASANVARVITIMNRGLGPLYKASVNGGGEVGISETGESGPPTRESQFFTDRLRSLVGESGTTTVSVVAGGQAIVGSYALSQIDIADIESLGVGQPGWDARAALLHELVEQREKQLATTAEGRAYGSATTGAHGQGLAAELGMIGAELESDSGLVGATTNADGTMNGNRTVVFKYPDGTRYNVEVTLSHNNITGATRTRLP